MAVAVDMRMQRRRGEENNLRGFHGIMLRKINLQLIGFIGIQSTRRTAHFNDPPLHIICDFVLESDRRINLPLNELLLKPVASYLAQPLATSGGTAADGGTGHCNSRRKWNKIEESVALDMKLQRSSLPNLSKCKCLHGSRAYTGKRKIKVPSLRSQALLRLW